MTEPTELDQMIADALEPDDDELHAWLADDWRDTDPDDGPRAEPAWAIDGERTATWAARKVLAAEAERAAAKAEADRLRAVAADYEARVKARTERTLAYFTGRLRAWHDELLAENPKRKTVDLPGARLERRAGGVSTEVTDPDALRAWLEDRDDAETFLDYPDPAIKKAAVKATFGAKISDDPGAYPALDEATGEVIPGVTFTRAVPSETIRPVTPATDDEADQ